MRDKYLRAGMKSANFVMAMARGKHPQSWVIRNISPGFSDIYETMAWADENHAHILDCKRHTLRCEGAAVVEFAIIRPTWEEIEEICP